MVVSMIGADCEEKVMKNLRYRVILAGAAVVLCLSGCGDGTEPEGRPEVPPSREATAEPAETEGNSEIAEYELKYASGEFLAEDYLALANLYLQEGTIKKQRDMLEQCYRLYGGQEVLDALAQVTVNLKEEDSYIRETAEQLRQNMELPEFFDEAVNTIVSPDFHEIMMPRMKQGYRSYYLEGEDGSVLNIQAGYDENGRQFSDVWYVTGEGQAQWLHSEPDVVHSMTATLTDGNYQGAYESWLVAASTGDVYHESGSFEQGICVGAYTAQVHFGEASSDLYSLWSNRADMDMTEYTGDFGTDGMTTLEQPDAAKRKTFAGGNGQDYVVYAYDSKKENYLFMSAGEANAQELVFSAGTMGFEVYPVYTAYEPKEDAGETGLKNQTVEAGEVKVRIFDGNVEWFDGSRWHTAGSVTQYMKEDPFRAYAESDVPAAGGDGTGTGEGTGNGEGGGDTSAGSSAGYERRGGGSVVKETPKPVTPKKPATPSTPQTPVTPETPAPSTPPADDGGNDNHDEGGGNNDNGGNDNGGNTDNGGGDNGGNPDTAPDAGGDVDIEWTDDIL